MHMRSVSRQLPTAISSSGCTNVTEVAGTDLVRIPPLQLQHQYRAEFGHTGAAALKSH